MNETMILQQTALQQTALPLFLPEVTLKTGWEELLGKRANDMPASLRRERWQRWLQICRESKDPDLADFWQDVSECEGCIHLDGDWCLEMELPGTVNPILTFRSGVIGMACMGGGFSPKELGTANDAV